MLDLHHAFLLSPIPYIFLLLSATVSYLLSQQSMHFIYLYSSCQELFLSGCPFLV